MANRIDPFSAINSDPPHIDSDLTLIHVNQGKGHKDRYALLPPELVKILRQSWLRPHSAIVPQACTMGPADTSALPSTVSVKFSKF